VIIFAQRLFIRGGNAGYFAGKLFWFFFWGGWIFDQWRAARGFGVKRDDGLFIGEEKGTGEEKRDEREKRTGAFVF
jgi:hypothetical protein